MGRFDSLASLCSIKYGALAILVLQNTFLVVFMRYSRTQEGPKYASSTAVVCMECLKFITCVLVIFSQRNFSLKSTINDFKLEVINRPDEILKISVPALLYVGQNNLLYYALSHLDTPTFQVGYQVKILTTALFSVIMLGRKLSKMQWISLIILTIGVSMAQLSAQSDTSKGENSFLGFVAVLSAACTSGFSGVYFEKMLKGSSTTLWMRNIQMVISSIILALFGVYWSGDYNDSVYQNGFFYGYTNITWMVVLLQAVGGLVVAVVVKYADNILKGFAASFSILTSCFVCIFVFNWRPTMIWLVGACLVNYSMKMYSDHPIKDKTDNDVNNKNDENKKLLNNDKNDSPNNTNGAEERV